MQIALVVAATSQTRVTRRCGCDGCGSRVHTLPDALATSMAATRSRRTSWSLSWTCSGSRDTPPGSNQLRRGWKAARGPRSGTENLTGVLEATVCDPSRSGPAPDLITASRAKITAASAGDQTAVFHAAAACPAPGDLMDLGCWRCPDPSRSR